MSQNKSSLPFLSRLREVDIMKLFHGSNMLVDFLKSGTYVTKKLKDAQKFGYRQSVLSSSPKVYIYTLEVNKKELKRDETRDGAYILLKEISITQVQVFNTYDVPSKLSNFTK